MTYLKQSRKPRRLKRKRIDYSQFALAKIVRHPPIVKTYDDGRMVFNRRTLTGKTLYQTATVLMAERQKWLCSICGKPMKFDEISFEHGNLRGMGGALRNDNIHAVDSDGFYVNSAAHGTCNGLKGGRRDYPVKVRLHANSQSSQN